MYASLYNQGRLDILEAVAHGAVHPLRLLSDWRLGRELALPPAEVVASLVTAWEAWAKRLPEGEHRRKVTGTLRALRASARESLEAAPRLLQKYRQRAQETPRAFNLARAHVRAFLREHVGLSHPLYLAVRDMKPLPTAAREKGTPHATQVLLALRESLGPKIGAMLWTMAVTGMGNKEYWVDGFDILDDRILIHGRKRKSRDRAVPKWSEPLTHPLVSEKVFRAALPEGVLIYDLRRSFARWCEEAGIIDTNRAAYLGHGPRTITDLYTYGQLPGQLTADAVKLRAYLDSGSHS